MAKYYNEYRSMRPKKGITAIIAIIVIILIAAGSCAVAFVIIPSINKIRQDKEGAVVEPPEKPEEPTLVKLNAPYELVLDITQTKLSWKCDDDVKSVGYRLKINDEEINVYTNPVTINLFEGIESVIYVKALGDNKEYADSDWSVEFSVIKQEAQQIAYNIALASVKHILESKVTVPVESFNMPVIVQNIYTIDYSNSKAKIWYSYITKKTDKVNATNGLAITTVSMPNITTVLEYKDKQSQIESIINNNNIDTEYLRFISEDKTADLLVREDLTGSLANFRHQSSVITPVCAYTSTVTVLDDKAMIEMRGIIRREKQNTVNYYAFNYTATTNAVVGYTDENYLNALANSAVSFTFTETGTAAEITGLGKEILNMYWGS